MKKKTVYSQWILRAFRIIGIIAITILIISSTQMLFAMKIHRTNEYLMSFISNCFIIILCFIFVLYPAKLGICSFISFYYAFTCLVFAPDNNMGIFMYWFAVITLYVRGAFNSKKRLKNAVCLSVYVLLILSEMRFEHDVFLREFINKIGYTFMLFLILFFVKAYLTDKISAESAEKKLDIKEFPNLTKRDAQWLARILGGEKYQAVAVDYKMSIGSVKNRFKFIFAELEVGDRCGFVNSYSGYEISFGDEFSSIINGAV